ncbi:MAG: hypothetical protein H6755_06000 [Candidatus Omnitrophica bacterium]|nr:hypothetical protein [Candidatus Omnitrophota bacterium]MCB9747947.1 hypothetical protein [Candidatus Omnitrophota bacterium]
MPTIRLTQKLQQELDFKPSNLVNVQSADSMEPFKEWYAHVYLLNRKKQLIFVEPQTLYSFSVEDVTRKDIRERFEDLFKKGLSRSLFLEGVSSAVMSKVMEVVSDEFVFAKTENRRTIGAMNEFVKSHKFDYGDPERPMEIRDRLNHYMPVRGFPNGSKKHEFPIDVFANVIKQRYQLNFEPHKKDFFKKIMSETYLD